MWQTIIWKWKYKWKGHDLKHTNTHLRATHPIEGSLRCTSLWPGVSSRTPDTLPPAGLAASVDPRALQSEDPPADPSPGALGLLTCWPAGSLAWVQRQHQSLVSMGPVVPLVPFAG